MRDLPKQVRQEIEKFFVATDELEDKQLKFLGWKSPKACIARFRHTSRRKRPKSSPARSPHPAQLPLNGWHRRNGNAGCRGP